MLLNDKFIKKGFIMKKNGDLVEYDYSYNFFESVMTRCGNDYFKKKHLKRIRK